jgi:hypothetical protein
MSRFSDLSWGQQRLLVEALPFDAVVFNRWRGPERTTRHLRREGLMEIVLTRHGCTRVAIGLTKAGRDLVRAHLARSA